MTADFTQTLLRWYEEHGRTLPWRGTTDPYAIWLSEVILQQTRIQQGEAYWHRFMKRWPTVESLAAASEDEVLREWQGLGYYSRARNLHKAAKQVVAMGGIPRTIEGLRKLKGVGDYTAAAIGSIGFGLPAAVVDGNVYRVLARHFGIDTPINTTEGKKVFTAMAQELLPKDKAAAFNQAMMDFGAIQCTPQSPDCGNCPLCETCEAAHKGLVASLPVKLKKLKNRERHFSYYYFRWEDEGRTMTAIRRRPAGDIWQGLWEPPMVERGVTPLFDMAMLQGAVMLQEGVKHVLTHQVIYADFYLVAVAAKATLPEEYIWVEEERLGDYAQPRLITRILSATESANF